MRSSRNIVTGTPSCSLYERKGWENKCLFLDGVIFKRSIYAYENTRRRRQHARNVDCDRWIRPDAPLTTCLHFDALERDEVSRRPVPRLVDLAVRPLADGPEPLEGVLHHTHGGGWGAGGLVGHEGGG